MKVIYIEWYDSHSFDEWEPMEDVDMKLPVIKTLGYLLKETKAAYAVTLNVGPIDCSCTMIIPKKSVKKKKVIKI